LMKLHTYGLLRNSFRPAGEIRQRRTYWRQRNDLVQAAGRHIQRMQKALTQMNVQLANVLSDISGKSGQAIIHAILQGERDPYELAAMCDLHVKASEEEVARALESNWVENPESRSKMGEARSGEVEVTVEQSKLFASLIRSVRVERIIRIIGTLSLPRGKKPGVLM